MFNDGSMAVSLTLILSLILFVFVYPNYEIRYNLIDYKIRCNDYDSDFAVEFFNIFFFFVF